MLRWLRYAGGLTLLLPTLSLAQAPATPTCDQRLAAVFGQYSQSIASNGEREANLRAEYEQRIAVLQQQLKALQTPPHPAAPAPPATPPAEDK